MRYLLLIYGAENGEARMSEGEQRTMMQDYFQYTEDLRSAGVRLNHRRAAPGERCS